MGKKKWNCIAEREFDGDIVITDPCYLLHGSTDEDHEQDFDGLDDWLGECGLESRTFYGDWGCTVFKTDREVGDVRCGSEELGKFCADGGMVCVVSKEDVLKRYPLFMEWADEHPWCVTLIKGFTGTVRLMTSTETYKLKSGSTYSDVNLHVRGDGEVDGNKMSFESVQTSL